LAFAAGGVQTIIKTSTATTPRRFHPCADGRVDIYRSHRSRAGVAFADEHEARTDPNTPSNIAEPVAVFA